MLAGFRDAIVVASKGPRLFPEVACPDLVTIGDWDTAENRQVIAAFLQNVRKRRDASKISVEPTASARAAIAQSHASQGSRQPSANARSPKAKRKRKRKPTALTTKQVEALEVVGECSGNFAEAAKRLGRDRSTVKEAYQAAMKKLGKSWSPPKPKTTAIRRDRRGQADVIAEDDRRLQ